jgi:GTP-binding protein HflX
LIHLVDASNPRWRQQISSVDRTLADLDLNTIPRLLVFNKADRIDAEELNAMQRESALQDGVESLAISALNAKTLPSLLDRIEAATNQVRRSELSEEFPVGSR